MQEHERLGEAAWVLRRFAAAEAAALRAEVAEIERQSPFRTMLTPGGRAMSVAMTNCGPLGWVSDRRGYRYLGTDPLTQRSWPAMPAVFERLARRAADAAGFAAFAPDACLINRYRAGSRLSLHQDRDEARFDAPIVSVSLGCPATFLFGGLRRSDPARRIALHDGDVVVWGGVDRLRYHGVLSLAKPALAAGDGLAPDLFSDGSLTAGADAIGERINLTFRRAA